MDSLFDIITWAQMQHLSDAVAHLGELVVQIPKPEKWGFRDTVVSGLSAATLILSGFSLWKNNDNAKKLEEYKNSLGKDLKNYEYQLAYHKVLAEKRLQVYQEFNNLFAAIYIKELDDGKVSMADELDRDKLREGLVKFIKDTFYLNKYTSKLYVKLCTTLDKPFTPETEKDIISQIMFIHKQIMEDIKNIHNLELWIPEEIA